MYYREHGKYDMYYVLVFFGVVNGIHILEKYKPTLGQLLI